MIKWIHQNKHSVTIFLIGGIVVLSMSIFSVDMSGNAPKRHALTIDGDKISNDEFLTEKRKRQQMLIDRYKQMLGNNFAKFAEQIYNIPNQQIVDGIIAENLVEKESKRVSLYVGEEQIVSVIRDQIFGGNFDAASYSAYLSRLGMSPQSFENQVRKEMQIQNYRSLLQDVSLPSKLEINKRAERQETAYDLDYVEIDPAKFEANVKAEDKELEALYNSNQTDYELPAKITYKYALLSPEKNLSLVEISEEDIELFYSDNQNSFMNPEELRVRHIQISIPKNADAAKLEAIKKKAEEVHAKAAAGEDFTSLAAQYSDDIATVSSGGDLGWLKKGLMTKEFDKVVFAQKTPGITSLISTGFSYQIAKIEEYKEPQAKKIEEVREQIKTALQKREAPAFTSAKANDIFAAWGNNQSSIEEMAKEHALDVSAQAEALTAAQDPDPALKGLTQQLMQTPDQRKQIIELGDKSILVEITNYQESRNLSFAEAKDKVLADFKKEQARKLAKEAAQSVLDNMGSDANATLRKSAESLKLNVLEKKSLTRASSNDGIFGDQGAKSEIFAAPNAFARPSKFVTIDGKQYIFQVKAINLPTNETLKPKFDTYANDTLNANTRVLVESNLNRLKAQASIDIDPSILGNS